LVVTCPGGCGMISIDFENDRTKRWAKVEIFGKTNLLYELQRSISSLVVRHGISSPVWDTTMMSDQQHVLLSCLVFAMHSVELGT
jgi:hypothetical protein